MNHSTPVELHSVFAADLGRAMLVTEARSRLEKDLPTLTKAELAELLFEQVGLNKREAKDMVETFFDEIRDALERGESVKLSGFGNFGCKKFFFMINNPICFCIYFTIKHFFKLYFTTL
jgi:integration host factor subunit alpha